MNIPETFKRAQRDVFQDKSIYRYRSKKVTGSLGSITTEPDYDTVIEYRVNVQPVSDAALAEEYGLTVGRDIYISTSQPVNIEKGYYIKYSGELYNITEAQKFDSHYRYFAKKVN